jgi:peptidoglycan/xylan/chitin deacetylase (PgdA/CDA1 family)
MNGPMNKRQAVGRASLAGCAAMALAAAVARRHRGAAAAIVAGGAAAAWGAFAPSAPLFGRPLSRGAGDRPWASLTFDDGPGPSTAAVLDALAREGVRATFFVLGRQVERYPELVRRIAAEGHEIGNHGFDHGILIFRGESHVADQLSRTASAVRRAVGTDVMRPLFRAPHGYRGPTTARAAARCGYRMAAWSRGVFDSAEPGVTTIAERAVGALTPGAVILLHDADGWAPEKGREQTAAAIPAICRGAREGGITLVPLGELCGV